MHALARLPGLCVGVSETFRFSASKTGRSSDCSLPPPCAPFRCLSGRPGQSHSQATLLSPSLLPPPVPIKGKYLQTPTFFSWSPHSSPGFAPPLPLIFSLLSMEHAPKNDLFEMQNRSCLSLPNSPQWLVLVAVIQSFQYESCVHRELAFFCSSGLVLCHLLFLASGPSHPILCQNLYPECLPSSPSWGSPQRLPPSATQRSSCELLLLCPASS